MAKIISLADTSPNHAKYFIMMDCMVMNMYMMALCPISLKMILYVILGISVQFSFYTPPCKFPLMPRICCACTAHTLVSAFCRLRIQHSRHFVTLVPCPSNPSHLTVTLTPPSESTNLSREKQGRYYRKPQPSSASNAISLEIPSRPYPS